MKRLFTVFILVLCFYGIAHSQDKTWLKVVTKEVGIDSARGSRVICADINGDNFPDLIWGTGNISHNHIGVFLNVPNTDPNATTKRKFIDFTNESGINANRDANKTGRVVDVTALADLDNDGDLDVVTSIYYHRLEYYAGTKDPGDRSEVLINDGTGHFTLQLNAGLNTIKLVDTLPVGLVNCTGLAYLDYDYDGKIDLFMSTWFSDYKSNQTVNSSGYKMRDALLKGNGDGSFTLLNSTGVESHPEPEYGVNVTDWNNDGWQDIITSPYCRSGGYLFKNNKDGTFKESCSMANYNAQEMGGDNGQALCQWEAQAGDYDNDGDMDLIQVNVHGGYNKGEGRTHLTINGGAKNNYKFEWALDAFKRDAPMSTTHVADDGAAWVDINGDGLLDAVIGQTGYSNPSAGINVAGQCRAYFMLQDSTGTFNEITDALGLKAVLRESHSMEPCDFDLDGDQDIFISHLKLDTLDIKSYTGKDSVIEYSQVELVENFIGGNSNWLSLKLNPPADCNKSAIGSRITIYSKGNIQTREIQAGYGHFAGQQPFIQNFGIAKERIDSVVVRWPNKSLQTTTLKYPAMNAITEMNETGRTGYIRNNSADYSIISFEESRVNFKKTNTGTQDYANVVVRNSGNKALNISNISIDDKNSVFTIANPIASNKTIAAGDTAHLLIGFKPTIRAIYSAKLTVASDASNESSALLDITGFGFEEKPIITLNCDSVVYNSTHIDSTADLPFIIKNTGEKDLVIDKLEIIGADSLVFTFEQTMPTVITPGDSTVLNFVFDPTEIRMHNAGIRIVSNAYNAPNIVVKIVGPVYGPTPTLVASAQVSFLSTEVGKTKEKVLTISNTGTADLVISAFEFAPNDGIFKIADGVSIPLTIIPAATAPVGIVFAPISEIDYKYNVIIKSNDLLNKDFSVALTGKGKAASGIFDDCNCDGGFIATAMPIPAKDNFMLKLTRIRETGAVVYLRLYDIAGNLVMTQSLQSPQSPEFDARISLPHLPAGLYNLNIQMGTGIDNIPLIIE